MIEIPETCLALAAERRRMFEREVEQDRRIGEARRMSHDATAGRALPVLDLISLFRRERGRGWRALHSAQKES